MAWSLGSWWLALSVGTVFGVNRDEAVVEFVEAAQPVPSTFLERGPVGVWIIF